MSDELFTNTDEAIGFLHDIGAREQEAGELLERRIDELESALASERAKTAAVEAVIEQVRQWRASEQHGDMCAVWALSGAESEEGCDCWKAVLDTILAAAPTAALDIALADARAGALEEFVIANASWLDPEFVTLMEDRAAEIREAQK